MTFQDYSYSLPSSSQRISDPKPCGLFASSVEQPKASVTDKKKRQSVSPIKQKSKAPPPVVVIADSTSVRVSSSQLSSAGRAEITPSALQMRTSSAASIGAKVVDEDEDEDEDCIEESGAALNASGASQAYVADDNDYEEVYEESAMKIEKWDDEDDQEDEDDDGDYSRGNDDKWEDEEDDVDEKAKEVEREGPTKFQEPDRPKFASFSGTAASS